MRRIACKVRTLTVLLIISLLCTGYLLASVQRQQIRIQRIERQLSARPDILDFLKLVEDIARRDIEEKRRIENGERPTSRPAEPGNR